MAGCRKWASATTAQADAVRALLAWMAAPETGAVKRRHGMDAA